MPTWPQFASIEVTDITTHHRDRKSTVLVKTNMHTGTHIDAPIHYSETGKHLGEIPLADLVGTGLVIDLRPITRPWSYYSLSDVLGCIPSGEEIREGDIVVFYTGWDRYNWTKPTRDDVMYFDRHPGPMPEVIDYLIDQKKIKWLGADLAAMDHSLYVRVRWMRPDLVREYEQLSGQPIDATLPERDFEYVHYRTARTTCACSKIWAASSPTWPANASHWAPFPGAGSVARAVSAALPPSWTSTCRASS